ncbi:MAG: ABC transporter ATP-binding protein [Acidimicrobiales bacterium]
MTCTDRSAKNSADTAIEADGLVRSFTIGRGRKSRTIEAVKELSFTVEAGERLAFIGPNGAGKSTSIKMLTGILFPTAGSATVLGLVPWQQRKELALRIGTLFGQRSQLWNELTPRTSLGVLGAIFGMTDPQTAARLGELGPILEADELYDQPLRGLSLGQRMRCELTACMLHSPEMLFLDEPTIGLDLLGKQVFRDLLVRVNNELGTTVLLTSHDVADIERVAERAIVVNHGTVIYDNTVEAMRGELLATKRITVGLTAPALAATTRADQDSPAGITTADRLPGVAVSDGAANELIVEVDTTQVPVRQVLDLLLAELPVIDLSIADPPLEAVIGEIYQRPPT